MTKYIATEVGYWDGKKGINSIVLTKPNEDHLSKFKEFYNVKSAYDDHSSLPFNCFVDEMAAPDKLKGFIITSKIYDDNEEDDEDGNNFNQYIIFTDSFKKVVYCFEKAFGSEDIISNIDALFEQVLI